MKPKISAKNYEKLQRVFNGHLAPTQLMSFLNELPNPDPILRKAGKTTQVYEQIMRDPHVIGELRTLRAGMFAFNTQLSRGGDDQASRQSYEMTKAFFEDTPDRHTEWSDLDWHCYSAILQGFSCLHLGPYKKDKESGYWLPTYVESWSNKSLAFGYNKNLLVKTRENPRGEETDPSRWTCVKHMPGPDNPYGIALLSSCFWMWVFKTGGFASFVSLCERFGIPFAVGKYDNQLDGDEEDEMQEELLTGLIKMLEDGVAAIPDGCTTELLETNISGDPLPLLLIRLCNAEISKCLTSQTMATEHKDGGTKGGSETHAKRAGQNQRADRTLVASARNQICKALHWVNFSSGKPAKFEYKDKKDINTETVSVIRESAKLFDVPEDWAREQLGIRAPKDGEAVLEVIEDGKGIATQAKQEFSQADNGEFDAFDHATEAEIKKIWAFTKSAKTFKELKTKITNAFPDITEGALASVSKLALEQQVLEGMNEAATE